MDKKVVIIDDRYDDYLAEEKVLRETGAKIVKISGLNEEETAKTCVDADGIIVNLAPLPGLMIEQFEKCRVISRYGVGVDSVDVETATRKGIWIANVPDYCDEDVSDQACALFLSCVRNTALRDKQVKSGIWDIKSAPPQRRIKGKTFVLFGYGRIARAMHRKIKGFLPGKILVFDPYVNKEDIEKEGAEKTDFDRAVSEGDFFSIHMPLNESTRGIFNETVFKKMKPGAIIVNTSRGPLINEKDLYRALSEGWIGSAGIDVFEKEPTDKDNPLLTLDNITVSGHTGFYTEESIGELKTKAAENISETILKGRPKYPVNQIEE